MKLLKIILSALLIGLLILGLYAKASYEGWLTSKGTPNEIAALIEPHIKVFKPIGDGSYPTILLFHGCGGDKDQQRYWAQIFQMWGYAAVVIDSYSGRGIDRERALSHVCQGRQLIGGERAGDILTAIAWAKQQAWIDFDNLTLAGWSHGAWSIMDAFALSKANKLPHNLNALPNANLGDIDNLVMFYPYCGLGDQGSEHGWNTTPNTLAITLKHDSVVGDNVCEASFRTIKQNANNFQHHVFSDVDHAYDRPVALKALGVVGEDSFPTTEELTTTEQSKLLVHRFLTKQD